jgi:hypothetical protein
MNIEPVSQNYLCGDCPDCGNPIPESAVHGDACDNCGHVFLHADCICLDGHFDAKCPVHMAGGNAAIPHPNTDECTAACNNAVPDMDRPYCEICGESHATWKMEDVGVCDDCFADECREALFPVLGKRCCAVYCQPVTKQPAICLAMYGQEHTHGEVVR